MGNRGSRDVQVAVGGGHGVTSGLWSGQKLGTCRDGRSTVQPSLVPKLLVERGRRLPSRGTTSMLLTLQTGRIAGEVCRPLMTM